MKRIILGALKVFIKKICMSFVYVLMLFLLPLVENIPCGAAIYSAFICLLLYYWIWRDVAAEGRKHMSKSQTPLLGAFIGAIAEGLTLLTVLAMFIFKNAFGALNIVYMILNLPFIGFIKPDGKFFTILGISPLYLLPIVLTVAVCAFAYFMGYKKIELGESIKHKLIYKNDEEGK